MAIYEYQCVNPHCGKHFDITKPVADMEQRETCPRCQTTGRRIYSTPAIRIN